LETVLLLGLACWSLGGIVEAQNAAAFRSYFKLILEMAVVVWCVSVALKYSGGMHWFYWTFVVTGVFNVLAAGGTLKIESAELVHGQSLRSAGINANPNSLGFYCFLGIFGALVLFGQTRSWWRRGGLMAAGGVCCYGLVASASRGPLLLTVLTLLLWPVFCFREKLRETWKVLFVMAAVACAVILGGQWLMENTFMGYRVGQGLQQEDSSSQARLNLASIGLRLCLSRPIFGIGLGQFPMASGLGAYAHNEWSELLATTGPIGFLLYMGVYVTMWRRLSRARRAATDSRLRYEINTARLIVVVLVVSGILFRPNFIYVDTMFLIGIAAGTGYWAKSYVRQNARKRSLAWMISTNGEGSGNVFAGPPAAPIRH
jgi:O-antigen ligase